MDAAERIARDLMTAGNSGRDLAESLHLHRKDGTYLGGWSLRGLADRIRKHLSGELAAMDRETVDLNEAERVKDGE